MSVEDALAAILRRTDAPDRLAGDAAQYLQELEAGDADDRAALAQSTDRLLVYRALVHNRLRAAIRDFIPRTVSRLGTDPFRATFARYMESPAPQSPYLRDVPEEFVEWAAPIWHADAAVPDYLVDLARHELLEYVVRNDPAGGEGPTGIDVALDRGIRFDGAMRLRGYAHAVHELPRDLDDRTAPPADPTELLIYRDPDHRVRYLALTPFAARLLHALAIDALALEPALRAACDALGQPLDDEKLASAASLLADLGGRGVALGAT